MDVARSLQEYVGELYRSYYAFALSGALTIVGVLGLFITDAQWLRIMSVFGLALGLLVAPFQAFHKMRVQRDGALGQDPLRIRRRLGLVNALSGSNWGIDNFAAVNDEGLVGRVVIAPRYPVLAEAEFDTALMLALRETLAHSCIEDWCRSLPTAAASETDWQLISPTKDYVVTLAREPVLLAGGGSELYARCVLQLPRSFNGNWALLVLDVVARDVPGPRIEGASAGLGGDPLSLDLSELFELLDTLVRAVDELSEVSFAPIVRRTRLERLLMRCRLRPRLRLVGPNLNLRARPRGLPAALRLPDFDRIPGATDADHLFIETPDDVDIRDTKARRTLLRRSIGKLLRQHEYVGFEEHVAALRADQPS